MTDRFKYLKPFLLFSLVAILLTACKVYTLRDVSIPAEVKTIKILYFDNKARFINPQLSPRLTDQFTQKVTNLTKLTKTNNDDAHWIVAGTITGYNVSTASISGQTSVTNRLTVTVHIVFTDTVNNKTREEDISRDFDFSANLSLNQAEATLTDRIVRNLSDEIFNRIFSNW
jgi:hypothetical protein